MSGFEFEPIDSGVGGGKYPDLKTLESVYEPEPLPELVSLVDYVNETVLPKYYNGEMIGEVDVKLISIMLGADNNSKQKGSTNWCIDWYGSIRNM